MKFKALFNFSVFQNKFFSFSYLKTSILIFKNIKKDNFFTRKIWKEFDEESVLEKKISVISLLFS